MAILQEWLRINILSSLVKTTTIFGNIFWDIMGYMLGIFDGYVI